MLPRTIQPKAAPVQPKAGPVIHNTNPARPPSAGGHHHPIKPLTGGQTYTATSFEVAMLVDSSGTPSGIRVRFFDANGSLIPDGAIKPVVPMSPLAMKTAVTAILATPGNPGETLSQHLARAATPFVHQFYGANV